MHRAEPRPDLSSACRYVLVSGRLAYTAAWLTWTKERVIDTRTKVTGLPRGGVVNVIGPWANLSLGGPGWRRRCRAIWAVRVEAGAVVGLRV